MLRARANSLIEVAHLSSLQVKSESTPDGSGRLLTIPKCPPPVGLTHGQRRILAVSQIAKRIVGGDISVYGGRHSSHV
jgi:hypothetical protein